MKKVFLSFVCAALVAMIPHGIFAQEFIPELESQTTIEEQIVKEATDTPELATREAEASAAARIQEEIEKIQKGDVTRPEPPAARDEITLLFEQRPVKNVNLSNFFAYGVQHAFKVGVPANTIYLVLLLPLLATLVAFVRHVVGLPTLGLYVPIALSITLVSTGVTAGLILLSAIIIAATIAKLILKRVRIMQLPKVALSMFMVSLVIFLTLMMSAQAGILVVKQLSIFPILLLILLSERVVELQLERTLKETFIITGITVALGTIGYLILTNEVFQRTVLLYPELVFLLIPANILIGRYFGLRLTEYYRFTPLRNAGK
ncbi:MAG: hypothetical protein N2691_04555 [Patescibacteria group bacterium]|nr:hypothetical protein [Patescibacteria group bacterium]